tara:strand:+ start:21823 stop:22452 length:630 start_codon:yes stop_codon:yes gene_type:complete
MTPFKFEKIQIKDSIIYFCYFSTYSPDAFFKYLSSEEINKVKSFASVSRRMEFVATRVLKHTFFGDKLIEYNLIGAPYIEGLGFISISHTHKMVAIALNESYKIGLDLESPRDSILSVSSKFLSPEEKQNFNVTNRLEVTKIWSAKETLYKLAGRKKIIFKEELILKRHNDNLWEGLILNSDHSISVKLNIFEHNEIIVTINNEPINIF